jgi:hypothetical protein
MSEALALGFCIPPFSVLFLFLTLFLLFASRTSRSAEAAESYAGFERKNKQTRGFFGSAKSCVVR